MLELTNTNKFYSKESNFHMKNKPRHPNKLLGTEMTLLDEKKDSTGISVNNNLRIDKIGSITHYAVTGKFAPDGMICADCGGLFQNYNNLFWVISKARKNKNVCNDCLNGYRTEEQTSLLSTKLGNIDNDSSKPLSKLIKHCNPYLVRCAHCECEVDLFKYPIYLFESVNHCINCLKSEHEIDPRVFYANNKC